MKEGIFNLFSLLLLIQVKLVSFMQISTLLVMFQIYLDWFVDDNLLQPLHYPLALFSTLVL